ncbi:MAG: preprotein translocase subunit YajC [Desulfobacterales bacterium]|uniref:Sec translocon accessory complex subunit YajC n=1 Tax=Candidatus Desulfatibia vada TaxID=2841696 RepID=A0A8J6P2P0_9BACT|nr:preprotein translocase subunit YajC [Candidatus Desulfatibia vada]MBL6971665.1 preprotein translocase subunit YajC [Desulfobacterales bacterium]
MTSIAYAMGQGGALGGQQAGGFSSFIPLILMFVIFYFLLIRPQQKKSKEHREMISNIKQGDRIVTSGGIHGRVTAVGETTMTLEIADKVRVKLARGNVAALVASASSQVQKSKSSKKGSEKSK